MKIAVSGTTGFVGRQLVSLLVQDGHQLLVVGAQSAQLRQVFPDLSACHYEDLSEAGGDYDLLIHLAVPEVNVEMSAAAENTVDDTLLSMLRETAKRAGIKRVLNVRHFQPLNDGVVETDVSRREPTDNPTAYPHNMGMVTICLPTVYGDEFSGKLSFLNRVPQFALPAAFVLATALTPVVDVSRVASFVSNNALEVDDGSKICLVDAKVENSVYQFFKRACDIVFAVLVICLFWWVLLIAWIWVKLESKGPGIFAQTRVGKHGQHFTCFKFRTMAQGTQQAATHTVSIAMTTRAGAFLRRSKIDELPQIWNILRGEISLIGPRPCLPSQSGLIEARRRRDVFDVMPGISGLAQANSIDMRDPDLLARWDALYVQQQSVPLDLRIMLATIGGRRWRMTS